MKRLAFFILLLFAVACNDASEEKTVAEAKPRASKFNFGYNLNDFNVVNDTVAAGDTFGGILEGQNIDTLRVYDIVQKIKDSFDVRQIAANQLRLNRSPIQ